MPKDAASDNDITDNATDNISTEGDPNEDAVTKDSDGGFEDFLTDVLGDELDTGDSGTDLNGDPDRDNSSTVKDNPKDNKDDQQDETIINVEDVEATDPEPAKANPLEEQVKALMQQNQQLMSMVQNNQQKPEAPKAPEPDVDIFQDESFSNLAESLDIDDNGKKALQAFLTKLVEHTQTKSVKQMLQETPDVIEKVMTSKAQIENVTNKFYSENAELAVVKPFVKELARSIAQENTSYDMAQVLEETAKKAYEVLGLTKKKADVKGKEADKKPDAGGDEGKKKPAFPKGTNVRKPPAKVSKLDDDIDDMLKTLD